MARFEFKLPDIGEGVVEGEIVNWLVKPGDVVAEDQPLVEVMTDKATVTIPAPKRGTIVETIGKVGAMARVHEVLLVIETDEAGARATAPATAAAPVPAPAVAPPPAPVAAAAPVAVAPKGSNGGGAPLAHTPTTSAPALVAMSTEKVLATPATRKLARDLGVDLRTVRGTGERGRVTSEDVRGAAERGTAPATPAAPAARAPAPLPAGVPVAAERIPFAGLRRRIAERMAQSKRTAAHFTFVEEVDMTSLVAMRERMKATAEKDGYKINYLPFIVKACVAALKKHPMLNASLDEAAGEIVLKKEYNIGIAVASDAGLVVPVVKGADRLSIKQISLEIERMAKDVRAGKAQLADLQGSTFTITSLGAQGGLFATPVINFPEVAIVGIHQIKQKPVVKNGQIVVGDVMLLSLSFDHRIVDGHVGAAFAYEVIGYLEDPTRLFLEMA